MSRVAKKSCSFVKAAFITSGVPATMGQLVSSTELAMKLGTWVRIGKKMASSGLSACVSKSSWWKWAWTTLLG